MRRRDFIKGIAGSAAAWPLTALAQQQAGKLPRIGSIQNEPSELVEALSQGLREAGYVDGQNIILDTRYHHGSIERFDEFAREFVALKCSVIVAGSPYAIRAVLKETNTIPTVGIDLESDPVANGWVKSLARPGATLLDFFWIFPNWEANKLSSSRTLCRPLRVWLFSGIRQSARFNSTRPRRQRVPRESRWILSQSGLRRRLMML